MKDLLTILAKGLVEDPASVNVTVDEALEDGTKVYNTLNFN